MKVIFIFLILIASCTPKWELRQEFPLSRHVWQHQSGEIIYEMSLHGFYEKNFTLGSIFTGKREFRFIRPISFATGDDRRIAVSDTGCQCVHLFIPEGSRYIQIFMTDSGRLVSPVGVIFDKNNRLFVADSVLGKVLIYDINGRFSGEIGGFKRPTGLGYDKKYDIIYVVDTLENRVCAINREGEKIYSFGKRGESPGEFNFPTYITVSDLIYIVDAMNFRVQVFDKDGRVHYSFGHHGNGSGDFAMPKGIAVDRDGIIYVVDSLFDNIQLFNEKGEFLLTLGARGTGEAEFWLPSCLFMDGLERLYICDTYNNRIQIFRLVRRTR